MIDNPADYKYVSGDLSQILMNGRIMPLRENYPTYAKDDPDCLRGEDVTYLAELAKTIYYIADPQNTPSTFNFSKRITAAQLNNLYLSWTDAWNRVQSASSNVLRFFPVSASATVNDGVIATDSSADIINGRIYTQADRRSRQVTASGPLDRETMTRYFDDADRFNHLVRIGKDNYQGFSGQGLGVRSYDWSAGGWTVQIPPYSNFIYHQVTNSWADDAEYGGSGWSGPTQINYGLSDRITNELKNVKVFGLFIGGNENRGGVPYEKIDFASVHELTGSPLMYDQMKTWMFQDMAAAGVTVIPRHSIGPTGSSEYGVYTLQLKSLILTGELDRLGF